MQQRRYKKSIDSHVAQKIATRVWRSVEAVLFRKGKSIHFKRFDRILSLEGKNNAAGLKFKDGRMQWFGLNIQPQIHHDDEYAMEALTHTVKYCRLLRKAVGSRYHYYFQLILAGNPPK